MKILVLSDSHRVMRNVYTVIEMLKDKIDAVIHLGDVLIDAEKIKEYYPNLKLFNVAGNCDFGTLEQSQKILEAGGKRIFITHGHRYNVKGSLSSLAYAALQDNADICLYGHTHFPLITKIDNLIIMNPGSISSPRGISVCSYGIIDIDKNGKITPSVVGIYDNKFKTIDVTKEWFYGWRN